MNAMKQEIKQQLSIIEDAKHEINGMLEHEMFNMTEKEQWICKACGDLPCIVTIHYSPGKDSNYERFQNKECPCKESTPEWRRIV